MKLKKKHRSPKFQTYTTDSGEGRWRLMAANGKVIAAGEGHTRKRDVNRAIEAVIRAAKAAHIEHL